MTLPASGLISMGMINSELAVPATQIISLNDTAARNLAQVPSGVISLSNFYGKSSIIEKFYIFGGRYYTPAVAYTDTGISLNESTGAFAAAPGTLLGPTGSIESFWRNSGSDAATNRGIFNGNSTPATDANKIITRNIYNMTTETLSSTASTPSTYSFFQSPLAGYFIGRNLFSRTPFATITTTQFSTPFTPAMSQSDGAYMRAPNFGMMASGITPPGAGTSRSFTVNYSTDTIALTTPKPITFFTPYYWSMPTAGYYSPGPGGGQLQKVSWATLTAAANANIGARFSSSSMGNPIAGYVFNGTNPITVADSAFSRRFVFSTETAVAFTAVPDRRGGGTARFKSKYTF